MFPFCCINASSVRTNSPVPGIYLSFLELPENGFPSSVTPLYFIGFPVAVIYVLPGGDDK